MNATQREPYYAPVRESLEVYAAGRAICYQVLCQQCRFFKFYPAGHEDPAEVECVHPLADNTRGQSFWERAFEGGDCWAFRPTRAARERVRAAQEPQR